MEEPTKSMLEPYSHIPCHQRSSDTSVLGESHSPGQMVCTEIGTPYQHSGVKNSVTCFTTLSSCYMGSLRKMLDNTAVIYQQPRWSKIPILMCKVSEAVKLVFLPLNRNISRLPTRPPKYTLRLPDRISDKATNENSKTVFCSIFLT